MKMTPEQKRLEYLRGELNAERISTGELIELQSLVSHIAPGDVQLLEAAGVPEFPSGRYVPSVTAQDEVIGDAIRDAFEEFIGHDKFVLHWGAAGWEVANDDGARYTALELGGGVNGWQFSKI